MVKAFLAQSVVRRKIAKILFSPPIGSHHARKLAKMTGHRVSSVQNQLKILIRDKYVVSDKEANRILFQANPRHKLSREVLPAIAELEAEEARTKPEERKIRGKPSAGRYKQMEAAVAAHKAEADRLTSENQKLRTGKQTHEKKSKDLAERLEAVTAELQSEQVRADVNEADCRRLEQEKTRLEKEAHDWIARAGRAEASLKTVTESHKTLEAQVKSLNRELEKRDKTIARRRSEEAAARGREKDLNEKVGALSAELEAARDRASESGPMIYYFCPNPKCGRKLSAPRSSAGHHGQCKTCGCVHVIPNRSDPAAEQNR